MVGNSLRSDVVPVVALGGKAVHIPYQVTWQHEHVPEEELPREGWRRISAIAELPALLDDLDAA
jgi:putative hydrolase of the HAD superfamily